ncbi:MULTISPECIES: EutN/CcmL family microcompartment protein [Clostridium]|jgi:ethanolamine utilization protein EutN|uniref:EutN/CcmL family microcompartment protein n=1 Tax=Clostridium TaxID=1485 RepID=UPI00031BC560|nr:MULTISPECIES: EutN/CcmL family microcompartment protein [Clostridium]
MIVGEVVGNLWATRKDEGLNGLKFLVVRKLDYRGQKTEEAIVAADSVGAGIGDQVLIVGGSSARVNLGDKKVPVDATIVGIVDSLELQG